MPRVPDTAHGKLPLWLIVLEVVLVLAIVALLVAFWLPWWIGAEEGTVR